jgi:hypothetical protein
VEKTNGLGGANPAFLVEAILRIELADVLAKNKSATMAALFLTDNNFTGNHVPSALPCIQKTWE